MTSERWVVLESLSEVSGLYYLEKFTDFNMGLELVFTIARDGPAVQLELRFEAPIFSYSISNETTRYKTVVTLSSLGFLATEKSKFFKVINSELLSSLSKKLEAFKGRGEGGHFVIVEADWIIEIIAANHPQIRWL